MQKPGAMRMMNVDQLQILLAMIKILKHAKDGISYQMTLDRAPGLSFQTVSHQFLDSSMFYHGLRVDVF